MHLLAAVTFFSTPGAQLQFLFLYIPCASLIATLGGWEIGT